MQINPALLASPGKSAQGHGINGAHAAIGANGDNGVRAAGHDYGEGNDSLHAFGSVLGNAMQAKDAGKQDIAASGQPDQRNEQAATPAVPAHAAEQAGQDEQAADDEAATAAGQLEGGLQAFVNSLQTPVTAMAMPASTAATAANATADAAADAVTNPAADGVAALATDTVGHGKGKGRTLAPGLDESQVTRSRAQHEAGRGDTADAIADATGTDGGKVDARDAHASLRALEVAASKVAPEFRAALNDAQAMRPGLQEAPAGANGNSSALPQAIAAAAAAGTPAATGANAATAQASHVAPHLHAPHWQDAFGQQVVWMAKNEQQIASLTMNPPDLGPVRVTLSVSDGQASAAFVSLQPEVRQAIQDAVPRLKEMLAEAGLQLQQASVDSGDAGGQPASRAHDDEAQRRTHSAGTATDADDVAVTADAASLRTARSIAASRLVDLFA